MKRKRVNQQKHESDTYEQNIHDEPAKIAQDTGTEKEKGRRRSIRKRLSKREIEYGKGDKTRKEMKTHA